MAQLATLPCCGEMIDRSFFFLSEPLRGRPLCPMCKEPLSKRLFQISAGGRGRERLADRATRGRSQSRHRQLKYEVREEDEEDRSPSRSPSPAPAPLSLEDKQAQADREEQERLSACALLLQHADAEHAEASLKVLLEAAVAGKVALVGIAGAVQPAVSALKKHQDVPAIQYYGCKLLWHLMDGPSESARERGLAAATAGAGEVAALALRTFVRDAPVQAEGCLLLMGVLRHAAGNERVAQAALQELVAALASEEGPNERCSDKRSRVEYVAQKVDEAGGVKLAKAIMRLHADSAGVQLVGCSLLLHIVQCAEETLQPKRRASVASGDGVQLAVDAMKAHAEQPAVQTECCSLLVELGSGSEQDRATLARAGCIELVAEAMAKHPGSADLTGACCSLLRQLTTGNDRRAGLVAKAGAIDLAMAGLRAHGKHPGVQSAGCALLMNLVVRNKERCAEVQQKGGMIVAANAIRNYTGNGPVQEAAGMLVATLQSGGVPAGGWTDRVRQEKPAWMSGPREVRTSTFYDTKDDGRLLF